MSACLELVYKTKTNVKAVEANHHSRWMIDVNLVIIYAMLDVVFCCYLLLNVERQSCRSTFPSYKLSVLCSRVRTTHSVMSSQNAITRLASNVQMTERFIRITENWNYLSVTFDWKNVAAINTIRGCKSMRTCSPVRPKADMIVILVVHRSSLCVANVSDLLDSTKNRWNQIESTTPR